MELMLLHCFQAQLCIMMVQNMHPKWEILMLGLALMEVTQGDGGVGLSTVHSRVSK